MTNTGFACGTFSNVDFLKKEKPIEIRTKYLNGYFTKE